MSEAISTEEKISTTSGSAKTEVFDIKEFLQKKGMYLIGGLVVVALLIGGIAYYNNAQKGKEAEARLALSRIRPYFDEGKYQVALDGDPTKKVRGADVVGLKTIADEYSGTDAGKTAALLTGNALFSLKKTDDAMPYFAIAAKSNSELVALGGEAGIAACHEEKKEYDKAIEIYEKIIPIAEKVSSKEKYLYYAGLCYEQLGNKDKAEKCYRDIIGEIDNIEFSGEAKAGLVRLGMVVE